MSGKIGLAPGKSQGNVREFCLVQSVWTLPCCSVVMCQQYTDGVYIGHLQLFRFYQYVSSDDYKERMALRTPLRLRVAQLQMHLRQNRWRERVIIVALAVLEQQQVRQGSRERTVWVKQWLPRALWHSNVGAHAKVVGRLQGLSKQQATHVPGDDRQTDPKNLKAPRLSAWLACWFEPAYWLCDFSEDITWALCDFCAEVMKITRWLCYFRMISAKSLTLSVRICPILSPKEIAQWS